MSPVSRPSSCRAAEQSKRGGFQPLWFKVDRDHYKIIQKQDPFVLQWYRDYVTVPSGRTKNVDTLANQRR